MTDASAVQSPPVSSPPPPWGLPLLAAASMLIALPLGSTFFVLFARALRDVGDDPYALGMGESAVSMAFNMGGWSMYAVVGAGLVLSVIAAVFVVFSARQNALFALPLPVFIAMPAALGAGGTNWGLGGAVLAVQHASPGDRATILAGSMSEALWSSTLGACVAAGLALSSCVALILAGFAQQRRAPLHARGLFVASGAAFALTVLAWLGATATQTGSSTWAVMAHLAPSEQVLGETVSQLTAAQSRVSVVTLVLVVLSLVLAAALGAKAGARVAFSVSTVLGVLLLSVSVRARPPKDFVEALSSNERPRAPLYVFDAPQSGEVTGIPLEDAPNEAVESTLEQTRQLHEAAGDYYYAADRVTFELRPNVSSLALRTALEQVAKQGIKRVTLLTGARETPGAALPPPFDALARRSRGVELKLLFRESDCPCDELKVEENGVRLEDESWAFGPLQDKYVDDYGRPVTLPLDEKLSVELVLKTANAAMAHDRKLGLLLEGGMPKPAGVNLYERAEAAPIAEVTVLDVKVLSGPLTAAALKKNARVTSMQTCLYEDTVLPRTIELEFALNESGAVLGATPVGSADDELALCASDFADFERVEPKKGFSLARVKYKFSAPAPKKD